MKVSLWILLLAIHGTMIASDWPQWRGPNRDGAWTESGILSAFPSTGLVPKWKVSVGFGYSSPIIANGMLYLSDLIVEKTNVHERVLCCNARSGKRVWLTQHDTSPPDWFFNPEQMRGPGSTPVIHHGRVYAISMFTTLECLDARTGTVIWKHELTTEYQLPPSSLDASPLVDGDLLIVSIGGKPEAGVVAFDLVTGREVWRALAEAATWSSPVIISAAGTRQLIVWMRQSVTSLNPTNGAVYWREPTISGGSSGFSAVSTPVIQGDRLLISGLMFQLDKVQPAAKFSGQIHPRAPAAFSAIPPRHCSKIILFIVRDPAGCSSASMPRRGVNYGKPTSSLLCVRAPVFTLHQMGRRCFCLPIKGIWFERNSRPPDIVSSTALI